jgi:hypothetical protein
VGGYDASLPIMEDADLCMRMHYAGAWQLPGGGGAAEAGSATPWGQPAPAPSDPCLYTPTVAGPSTQQPPAAASSHAAARSRPQAPLAPAAGQGQGGSWWQQRGRVKMILDRQVVTSGRRLERWGNLYGTYVS